MAGQACMEEVKERQQIKDIGSGSKTQAANPFHTAARGNWTKVNICQCNICLKSVTPKDFDGSSLCRFVELSRFSSSLTCCGGGDGAGGTEGEKRQLVLKKR